MYLYKALFDLNDTEVAEAEAQLKDELEDQQGKNATIGSIAKSAIRASSLPLHSLCRESARAALPSPLGRRRMLYRGAMMSSWLLLKSLQINSNAELLIQMRREEMLVSVKDVVKDLGAGDIAIARGCTELAIELATNMPVLGRLNDQANLLIEQAYSAERTHMNHGGLIFLTALGAAASKKFYHETVDVPFMNTAGFKID